MQCLTKCCVCLVFLTFTVHGVTAALSITCADNNACSSGDPNAVCAKTGTTGGDDDGNCICTGTFKNNTKNDACVAKVITDNACTANAAGNTTCQGVDPNAMCPASPTKCACKAGYFLSTDKTTCVQTVAVAVTDTTCPGGNTDCKVQHSECDNAQSAPKCKCSEGYEKDSTDGGTCVKIPAILETACPNSDGDCTAANSVCDGADSSPKCKCSDGFRQDTKDHTKCKKELGQACSEGECLTNAQCDTTCKCSDEQIEKDGLCVVPSSTIKAGLSEIVMIMWVLCVVILRLF